VIRGVGWAIGLVLLTGMVVILLIFVRGIILQAWGQGDFNPILLIFPILLILGIFGDRSRRR
jgi:hypothetical protein